MKDYYQVLDSLFKEEIDKGQTIAIYPFGKVGLLAENILSNRYGHRAVYIDNYVAGYNGKAISIDEFEKMDSPDITIILCASSPVLNEKLTEDLKRRKIKAKVRSILDDRLVIIQHSEKEDYFKRIKNLCAVSKATDYELIRIGGRTTAATLY